MKQTETNVQRKKKKTCLLDKEREIEGGERKEKDERRGQLGHEGKRAEREEEIEKALTLISASTNSGGKFDAFTTREPST